MTTFNDIHRWTYALLAACVFFFLFQATITAQPPDESAEESADSPVHIPDAALRRAIEAALEKSAGEDITQAEMATLTRLIATDDGISDLTGLEYATSLTILRLGGNPISDVSPLETLTELQRLALPNCWITDISVLKELNKLMDINLANNLITDVSPLMDLPALMWLLLYGNSISDVTPFRQATSPILVLSLANNKIVDVSPLAAFVKNVGTLCNLILMNNPATDFSSFSGLKLVYYDFEVPIESTEESIDIPDPVLRRKILQAVNKNIGDPLTVADLESLDELTPSGATDFTGLEHAVNLEALYIYNTGISDIGPLTTNLLQELTALKSLSIVGSQYNYSPLVNITPLAQLTQLEELNLAYNRIVDVSPLTSLTKLKKLFLHGNLIEDDSPLDPLRAQLRTLALDGNPCDPAPKPKLPDVINITDAGLRAAIEEALGKESGETILRTELESLTTLDASNRGIREITGLYYATGITSLDLSDNEITNTLPIRDLTQLVRLELAGNRLTGPNLTNLVNLTYLDISRNLIANVNALSVQTSLSSVTTLNVSGNHIADVSPLAKMTQLNELYISDNPDTDYSSLAMLLPTLDDADFSYDPGIEIPDTNLRAAIEEALGKTAGEIITQAEMETLRKLTAKRAGITDITGLEYAINLRQLDLSRNKISDVSPLAGLTRLKRLYLNRNRISDFSAIAGITDNLKRYKKGNQKTGNGKSKNTPTLNADVNRDNVVDATDLDIVSRYTGLPLDSVESGIYPDVNGDGTIDTKDVLAVTERLGSSASGTTQ